MCLKDELELESTPNFPENIQKYLVGHLEKNKEEKQQHSGQRICEDENCSLKPKMMEIDGETWPPVFQAENVRSAKGMELEAGDTLVCTYPKCGTTWVQHICSQLIFPGQYGAQGQKELCFTSPMIERMGAAFCADQLAPHARLLKTRFSWANCPKSGAAKFIFVARNPKDCLVSFFHHHRSFRCYQWAQGEFDVFFELFMAGRLDFGDYFDHLLGWLPHLEERNVLFLKYEQMVADLEGAIRRIGAFLGGMAAKMVESEAKLGEIVAASRFDAMQSKQEQFFPPNALQNNFIRKGGSRDWKNWMSRRQSDRLDALFQAKMKGTAAEGWWRREMQWEDEEGEKENEWTEMAKKCGEDWSKKWMNGGNVEVAVF